MTQIVVANRSGLAEAPDGSKHRLVRGRTLADARHPLAKEHPDLFSAYAIDLPYDDEADASLVDQGSAGATARAEAKEYRAQLAAVVDVLFVRDKMPVDDMMNEPGWLARAVAAALDGPPTETEVTPAAPELPTPPPRKRAPRRPVAPAAPAAETPDAEE